LRPALHRLNLATGRLASGVTALRTPRLLTHKSIWKAIDELAASHGLSTSGLARRGGLDPTAFNVSKRFSRDGKPRWPSTESLSKVLDATGATIDDFAQLIDGAVKPVRSVRRVPVIGMAQAGASGYFDDGGYPVGNGWDEVAFPDLGDPNAFALEINGDSMEPVYRDGDLIIVSPAAGIRRRDRVVLKTTDGEVMAKELTRRTARQVVLNSFNPSYEQRVVLIEEVAWIARIVWASQ
jgi:phage repressor protein C with HTH and peptisase S24 domain